MRFNALFVIALAVVGLSGCAETSETAEDLPLTDVAGDNATVTPQLLFTADVVNGTAPLYVNFTIDATNVTDATNATWVLTIGDDLQSGSSLPATVNHTFDAGNHTVSLEAILDDISYTSTINITVEELPAEPPRELPEQTHFEFPESLGCVGDFGTCASREGGPDASGIDGFWQALNESYWGLSLTSTVGNALGDSDCQFYDDGLAQIGEGNNGGAECVATIPDGTAWIFIYSYAEPATSITFDVALA